MRAQIIWAKDRFAFSRGPLSLAARALLVCGPRNGGALERRPQAIDTMADPSREDDGHGHGTQKPVECMKRPIENNSSPGQAVYEPFCGSGTTIIAAEMTGRSCHAIETRSGLRRCRGRCAGRRSRARTPSWTRAAESFAEVATERAGEPRLMGRRAHKPDPAQRRQVEAMAAYGIPEINISASARRGSKDSAQALPR